MHLAGELTKLKGTNRSIYFLRSRASFWQSLLLTFIRHRFKAQYLYIQGGKVILCTET